MTSSTLRTLALALLLGLAPLCARAQEASPLTVYGLRKVWGKTTIVLKDGSRDSLCVKEFAKAFAAELPGQAMIDAAAAKISASDFEMPRGMKLEVSPDGRYLRLDYDKAEPANLEMRLWPLDEGGALAAVKITDPDEDTIQGLEFWRWDGAAGAFAPAHRAIDGLMYGDIVDFGLPREGWEIAVRMGSRKDDAIVVSPDGGTKYVDSIGPRTYLYVSDKSDTNIRQAPGGKVIAKLPARKSYAFEVRTPRGGWWRIVPTSVYDVEDEGEISLGEEAWIHSSVLGATTRNYGGESIPMYSKPDKLSEVVGQIDKQEAFVQPRDLSADGDWVMVTFDGRMGWIEEEWLCGNPVSTCP